MYMMLTRVSVLLVSKDSVTNNIPEIELSREAFNDGDGGGGVAGPGVGAIDGGIGRSSSS